METSAIALLIPESPTMNLTAAPAPPVTFHKALHPCIRRREHAGSWRLLLSILLFGCCLCWGLQPAWDDLSVRKRLLAAGMDRASVINEYTARLAS